MPLGDAQRGQLSEHIVGFGRTLRRAGLPMDSARIALALQAAECVGLGSRLDLRHALRAVMVSRHNDVAVFDALFDACFRHPGGAQALLAQALAQAAQADQADQTRGLARARAQEALSAPQAPPNRARRESDAALDAAMSANALQRLRQADFASLNASEYRLVESLARGTALPLPRLPGRRTRAGWRGHALHWGKTLALARRHEGEVLLVPRRQRRLQTLPLVILTDVSGSMERYARLLLAFLHRATRGQRRAAYAFGTGLTDLNPAFRLRDTDHMLAAASLAIQDFAGGTRLGESLTRLRQGHARQLVGRRSVVLLISDGLDTGDPDQLEQELIWLRQHSRRVLWLNPLLRFEGYAPLATGAKVLHRHAHGMLAVHNLSKLEDLASAMAALLRRA